MSSASNPSSNWGSGQDWSSIISSAAQGASAGMQGSAQAATSKKEAKESRRRTLANILTQALKRRQGLFKVGQEYSDELNDYQTQAMQQAARGFVNALQGSTGRGYK